MTLEGQRATTVEFSLMYFFHQKSVAPGRRAGTAYYMDWTKQCCDIEMHMQLTFPLLYLSEFISDSTVMNCLKASKSLGNEHVPEKWVFKKIIIAIQ